MQNTKTQQQRSASGDNTGVNIVIDRAFFYRDKYRSAIKLLLILSLITLFSVILNIALVYLYSSKEREYFAMSNNGNIIKLKPFSEPVVTESRMLQFAGDAATCVYTFDFANYREQLKLCSGNFTSAGWDKFTEELGNSKLINLVTNERIVLSATRTGSPVKVDTAVINGALTWKVQVPVRVTYSGRSSTLTEDYLVRMNVSRASQIDYQHGIAISSFVATKYSGVR